MPSKKLVKKKLEKFLRYPGSSPDSLNRFMKLKLEGIV